MNDRLLKVCYLILALVAGLLIYNIERVRFDFDEQVMNKEGLVMVVWEADWCPSCQRLRPVLEQIKVDRNDVSVVQVNVDKQSELWSKHGSCSGIPCVVFMRDGQYLSHFAGFRSKFEIESHMSQHLPMEI